MARVDVTVPKIALVGDEEGTLFALDVASGEILRKHDAERVTAMSIHDDLNLTQFLTLSDINSSGSSSGSGSSKGRSSNEKIGRDENHLGPCRMVR